MNYKDFMRTKCAKPSAEIQDRNLTSIHLFTEVLKLYSDGQSDVAQNNNCSILNQPYFDFNPYIHRGYYDEKKKGVLYVKDADTGELIRKDESYLLSSTEFVSKKSPRIILEFGVTPTQRVLIKQAKEGNTTALATFKDKYYYSTSINAFLPLDLNYIHPYLRLRDMVHFLTNMYGSWINRVLGCSVSELESVETLDGWFSSFHEVVHSDFFAVASNTIRYREYFPEYEDHWENDYLIPDTSNFAPGLLIGDHMNLGRELRRLAGRGEKAYMSLSPHCSFKFSVEGLEPRFQVVESWDLPNSPFKFIVDTQRHTASVAANRPSYNNEGQLLGYQTRVTEYKVPFMKTEAEDLFYKVFEKDHKQKIKEHKAKRKEAEIALLRKHPDLPRSVITSELDSTVGKEPKLPCEQLPIYLGIEIEAVARQGNDLSTIIKDMAKSEFGKHHISKSDGSIGHNGIEIVTIPATLKYHKKMFEDHFFSKPNEFHRKMMATEQCGIHVHLAKNAFTPLDLGKFMNFIDSSRNRVFIDAMAGRGANVYCIRHEGPKDSKAGVNQGVLAVKRACQRGLVKDGLATRRLEAPHGDNNLFRRVSVNIQNAQTVEVRIFKSSTNKNNIIRKIEFCESLLKFVRRSSLQQMTTYDYVEFLLDKANSKDYPCMIRWLASKGYISHKTEKIQGKNKLVHIYSENKVPKPKNIFHNSKQGEATKPLKHPAPKPKQQENN